MISLVKPSTLFITDVDRHVNKRIHACYKASDFTGSYNKKFRNTKAARIMINEYKIALSKVLGGKKYKKAVIKYNDLFIMKHFHPSILSLDLRAFLQALDEFEIEERYLIPKPGGIVPSFHNLKMLNMPKLLSGLKKYNVINGNRLKLQEYLTNDPDVPQIYIPKIFDKETLVIILNDAKTNSFNGATIATKVAVVGTTGKRMKYHRTLDPKTDSTNYFGKWLALYSQILEKICAKVATIVNFKYHKEGDGICQSTCTFFESYPNEKPFILSGDGIVQLDYAGELIVFGEPRTNVMKAYKELYGAYPEIYLNGQKADEQLLAIHRSGTKIGYNFPIINLKRYEKVFPGLVVEEEKQCQDGCSGMLDYSLQMNIALGQNEYPRPCENRIRIIAGKPQNPKPKRRGEILVAHGDCAIRACKKAKIKPDVKFSGCPVAPVPSLVLNFLIPGFPHTNDVRGANMQYGFALLLDDLTNTWLTWKQILKLMMNGRNLVSILHLLRKAALFQTKLTPLF